MKILTVVSLTVTAVLTVISSSAIAIPAFARKYNTDCSSCHTAYPQLNAAGRKFKEAGYAFPKTKGEVSVSDFLNWDEHVPVSILVKSRPYDKKTPGDEKLRAIHEVEVLSGGRFSENVSGFIELEAEDEDVNARGFEIGVAHAWLTVRQSDALNAQIAWGPILSADPYDTYSAGRRLTRGTQTVIDNAFGGADSNATLASARQTLSAFGRPTPALYYNLGVSGNAGDSEGENFGTYFARLAFDASRDVMLGALMVTGTCEINGVAGDPCELADRDFSRLALDAQADIGDMRFMAVWMTTDDDNAAATAEQSNDAFYLHGQYAFKDNGRPVMVAMVRLDEYEKNNGAASFSSVTFNLSHYFTQNIKGFIEYWDQYDGPTAADEKSRITFQAEAAF